MSAELLSFDEARTKSGRRLAQAFDVLCHGAVRFHVSSLVAARLELPGVVSAFDENAFFCAYPQCREEAYESTALFLEALREQIVRL